MADEELIHMLEGALLSKQPTDIKRVEDFEPFQKDDFLSPTMILESADDDVDDGSYDSKKDTNAHIKLIRENMRVIVDELRERAAHHDESKLKEPEKSCYDKYIPELKKTKYGTKEYYAVKDEMGAGLKHHFKENRHHPEHWKNGVNDMTLVDVMEMFVDWYSASQLSESKFPEGLESNTKTHKLSPQLKGIILNTYNEYFK